MPADSAAVVGAVVVGAVRAGVAAVGVGADPPSLAASDWASPQPTGDLAGVRVGDGAIPAFVLGRSGPDGDGASCP